jgi:hypothetical protein
VKDKEKETARKKSGARRAFQREMAAPFTGSQRQKRADALFEARGEKFIEPIGRFHVDPTVD